MGSEGRTGGRSTLGKEWYKVAVHAEEGFDRYAELRRTSRLHRDGVVRRTEAVLDALRRAALAGPFDLLDVGTADGAMLAAFAAAHPAARLVGVEARADLVTQARARGLDVREADVRRLPFPDASFDVVTMVSTLKHVEEPERALAEVARVLRRPGHLVVGEPTPFGIRMGVRRGHFDPRWLPNVWSLAETRRRLAAAGFRVVHARRYMPLPVRCPGDRALEALLRTIGASRLCMQQLTLARRAAG